MNIRSYSVGVTTLEEVFLKIGHGEDVEKEREEKGINLKNQGEKLLNIKAEDQELEDYTIATDSVDSSWDQFCNLTKK